MSSSLGELRFPLEDRFLAHARVNDNRFDEWKTAAQKEIDSVLANPRSWYYRPNDLKQAYRPVYEQDAIRGFVRTADDNSTKRDLFGLAHLELTLEELTTGFLATTTADQRAVLAQLYGEALLDGAVLQNVESPHASDPFHFVGLKWLAFGSPAPAIITHRDYVYFECSGTTYDISNRKVLFVYQRSFPLQTGEISEPEKGCSRGEYYQLMLFRMEGGGVLLQGISTFEPQADAPSWVTTRVVTETFDAIKNFVGLAEARAIAAAGMLKQGAPPKIAAGNKGCVVCQKKFGMMRTRHGCRSCGQSMCKHCVTKLSFFNDEALFSTVPTVMCESFCLDCIKRAKSQRQLETLSTTLTNTGISVAKSESSHTTTANMSSPYEGSARQHHRNDLRTSISRQVGVTPSDSGSGSDAGGSSRSLYSHTHSHSHPHPHAHSHSYYNSMAIDSPASASYVSSSSASHAVHQTPEDTRAMMFEQMNASIRQQEELLQVIQQERAKLQGRQQHHQLQPPAPMGYATPYAPPLYDTSIAHAIPVSPTDKEENTSEARFEVLS